MKHLRIFAFMFCFCLNFLTMQMTEANPTGKTLMIAPCQAYHEGVLLNSHPLNNFAYGLLTAQILNHKAFRLVEREYLEKILQEHSLSLSGLADQNDVLQVGKLVGAKYTLFPEIHSANPDSESNVFGGLFLSYTQTIVRMSFRLVDNETGEIIFYEEVEGVSRRLGGITSDGFMFFPGQDGAAESATKKAIKKFMKKFVAMYPLTGSIADINGKDIYIDIGRNFGVKKGQKFIVYTEEKPVYSSKEKQVIGVTKIKHGELKVKSVEDEMAICSSGDDVKVGMIVELKK